jgi:hypothetical protein
VNEGAVTSISLSAITEVSQSEGSREAEISSIIRYIRFEKHAMFYRVSLAVIERCCLLKVQKVKLLGECDAPRSRHLGSVQPAKFFWLLTVYQLFSKFQLS